MNPDYAAPAFCLLTLAGACICVLWAKWRHL